MPLTDSQIADKARQYLESELAWFRDHPDSEIVMHTVRILLEITGEIMIDI